MSELRAICLERCTEVGTPFSLQLSEEAAAALNRIAIASMLDPTLPEELRDFARDLSDLFQPHITP